MARSNKLEPLDDGWVAFHTESGERWKHKDVINPPGSGEPHEYRLFVSDKGEQRRYVFRPVDPRDVTVEDLRYQLTKAEAMSGAAATR